MTSDQYTHLKKHIADLPVSNAGRFFYYCMPIRKKIVLNNMRQVFSKMLSEQEIHTLAKSFYSHLAKSLKENIVMRFWSLKRIQSVAKVINHEIVLAANQKGSGVIILTGHFGNWELAPIAGLLNFQQFKGRFHVIRKTLRNKFLEKIIFRRYYRAGLNVLPKKNSLDQVCAALEQQDAVIFVMDQHAHVAKKDGIMVDFFGKPAGTYRSLAMIARHMKVSVFPAMCYRDAQGKHILQFFDAIDHIHNKNSKQELYLNTLAYNQALERMVLARPEQWLWMHKRWKHG